MLGNSHLLIKNLIINHIFRTLDDEVIACRLHFMTFPQASIKKGLKGLQGQRTNLSGSSVSYEGSYVTHLQGPAFRIQVLVIMQNLFGSQLMYHPSTN